MLDHRGFFGIMQISRVDKDHFVPKQRSYSRFSRDVTVLSKYGRSPYLCPSKCEIIWKREPSLSSFRVFLSCSADLVWIYPRKLRKKK